ncbi:MAG: Copper type ascorbate-dependent monooxygenase, C-terminal domain protein [Planctomycetota bacterium]|nr:Copper type ascorbate-dependent monooxygenase, C-terminal domain protein [Planctomycetota bacterium]
MRKWCASVVVGVLSALPTFPTVAAEPPTYNKDVAPILQRQCQDCHRPGQVAPFSLLTFHQARKRAADLVSVTAEKRMPPWHASTIEGGPFKDARVLSAAEIATIAA